MSTGVIAGILLLILGFLLVTVWNVHILLLLLGVGCLIAGVIWVVRGLTGGRANL